MGRKNRKARSAGQNPRRFYREKRREPAQPREEQGGRPRGKKRRGRDAGAWDGAGERYDDPALDQLFVDGAQGAADPGLAGLPTSDHWNQRETPARTSPRGAAAKTCGRCAEWVPRRGVFEATGRGECLHPGSGVLRPPADMEACDFYH